MIRSHAVAAVFLVMNGIGLAQDPNPRLFDGLGPHKRKVTTSSQEAQAYFDQGLNFLYGFNHKEALNSFRAAAKADPSCGMAWWGIAAANGPHINLPMVTPEEAMEAVQALDKARASMDRLSAVEKDLVSAALRRFAYPQPEDRTPLDRAYADEMREVWKSHPKDADVGALFAEAMMDLRPWDLWTPDGKPQPGTEEITKALGDVFAMAPKHPLALHLTIHAWEASPTPEKAEAAANNLRMLQPGLGHMVHMPSHIDVRLGNWQEAIASNERAIDADEKYRALRPQQGFYRIYMAHNRHMLAFAAMMAGNSKKAIEHMDMMAKGIPPEWIKENAGLIDGYLAMPLEARIRFGKWDDILAYPAFGDHTPIAKSLRHMARGVAYAAKGQVKEAKAEQTAFTETRKLVPEGASVGNSSAAAVLQVAQHVLAGEVLLAENRMPEAVAELRQAVDAESQLRYDEPPDWVLPSRHILGVALLKAKRYAEAEEVYRKDLQVLPNNVWSLRGLSQALNAQNKAAEAADIQERFKTLLALADTEISSSCMCVPDP